MRKPRILVENAEYHVTARSNRQEFIFQNDKMKDLFLEIIAQAKKKYSFRIRNLCIMSNHVHLMIQPGKGESLSRILQWILSVFAQRFNKICGYHGHVWYDRFKSKVIYTYRQFLAVFQYISQNPVKAKMVQRSIEYKYNGIRLMWDKRFEIIEPPDSILRFGVPDAINPLYLPRS